MKNYLHIYTLSASISALALAFAFLAVALNGLTKHAPALIEEVNRIQSVLPEALEVAEGLRAEIPQHLDRLEYLLERTEEAGKQAGEGVVSGVLKGTVNAPISLFSALFEAFPGSSGLSRSERDAIAFSMDKLLLTEQPGVIYPFDYAATGMTGILELLEVDADQDPPIFKVSIEVLRKSKLLFSKELMLQRDKRDRWKVIENMNT